MIDQFVIEPLSAYSASYNDGAIVGQIQSISSDLSGGFVRQIIGSKSAIELNTTVFSSKNLLYSERLNFTSGSAGRGASSILFSQNISANEKIFDSFVPSPPEISLTNGTIFASTEGSGGLPGSTLHGIPPTKADSVDLIITDDPDLGPANFSSPILDEISDLNWGIAKWPFRSKYKNLNRIFNASFQLPRPVPLTKNFKTGATINPPITASLLGTIIYASSTKFGLNFPDVFSATPDNADDIEFKQLPVLGRGIGYASIESIALCNSPNSPTGSTITPVYIAVGGTSESYLLISTDGVNWTSADPTVLNFGLQDIAYSVNESGNNSWAAWAIITKSNSTPILTTTTNKIPSATSWVTKQIGGGLGTGNEIFGITFNDPEGAFPTNSHFVICGGGSGGGFVVTSSDRVGTFWSTKTFISSKKLFDICYSTSNNTLIVVGETGTILTSNNRQGSAWTSRNSTVTDDLYAVAHRDGTSTVIAVGNDGTIIRSTNNGQTWTNVSPGGFKALYDVAPGNPNDDINWIVVGADSLGYGGIAVSIDDGVNWKSLSADRFENYTRQFRAVVAAAINANSNALTGGPKYVAGGEGSSSTRNLLMRVTDLSSEVFITSSTPSGQPFIHELATLSTGGLKTVDTQVVRAKFEDFSKAFFGYGNGVSPNFEALNPNFFGTSATGSIYFRRTSPDFIDFTAFNPGSSQPSIEAIRVHAPIIKGWGYGLFSGIPTATKAIWRRDKYGQFRDMLEQRLFTKLLTLPEDGGQSVTDSPVKIRFVSGSLTFERSKIYLTASNPDFNPTDSGEFDFEAKSGQPYFDDVDLTQFR